MNNKGDQDQGVKSPRSKSPVMGVTGLMKELAKNAPPPQSAPPTEGERRTSSGILKLDPTKPRRRSSATSVELRNEDPSSPCPSDRLSVTWADGEKSVSSDASVTFRGRQETPSQNPSMITLQPASAPMSPSPVTSPTSPSGPSKGFLRDPELDNDLDASVSVILQRSSSMRASKKRSRRKSTIVSTSSGDSQVNLDSENPEEKVKLFNEVLAGVKHQPWPMKKKLYLARMAKDFLAKHEGELEQRLAQSTSTKDVLYRYFLRTRRVVQMAVSAVYNWVMSVELWKGRIKRIESHFGSAVASYFTFLRWVIGLNAVMMILLAAFVIVPETLAGDWMGSGERKRILKEERVTAFDLKTLWVFEGILRYSPIFYGFYGNKKATQEGYRLPLAYILTSMCVYGYSFIAILRKMAANSRMSKLGDDDQTVFTFRLFASWDFTIGNTEAAQNKVASINMGFREALLEAREADKEEKSWKVTAKRGLAHFLVLCLLVGSAYAVILLVDRSKGVTSKSSWWRQNELSVILTLISQEFPALFDLVGRLENHHPRKHLQWQLARIMALNLLNLYTLIFALFGKVNDMSTELMLLKEGLPDVYNASLFEAANVEVDPGSTFPTTFGLNETITPTATAFASLLFGLNVTTFPTNSSTSLNFTTGFEWNATTQSPKCRQIEIPCPVPESGRRIPGLNPWQKPTPRDKSTLDSGVSPSSLDLDVVSPALGLVLKPVTGSRPVNEDLVPSPEPKTISRSETGSLEHPVASNLQPEPGAKLSTQEDSLPTNPKPDLGLKPDLNSPKDSVPTDEKPEAWLNIPGDQVSTNPKPEPKSGDGIILSPEDQATPNPELTTAPIPRPTSPAPSITLHTNESTLSSRPTEDTVHPDETSNNVTEGDDFGERMTTTHLLVPLLSTDQEMADHSTQNYDKLEGTETEEGVTESEASPTPSSTTTSSTTPSSTTPSSTTPSSTTTALDALSEAFPDVMKPFFSIFPFILPPNNASQPLWRERRSSDFNSGEKLRKSKLSDSVILNLLKNQVISREKPRSKREINSSSSFDETHLSADTEEEGSTNLSSYSDNSTRGESEIPIPLTNVSVEFSKDEPANSNDTLKEGELLNLDRHFDYNANSSESTLPDSLSNVTKSPSGPLFPEYFPGEDNFNENDSLTSSSTTYSVDPRETSETIKDDFTTSKIIKDDFTTSKIIKDDFTSLDAINNDFTTSETIKDDFTTSEAINNNYTTLDAINNDLTTSKSANFTTSKNVSDVFTTLEESDSYTTSTTRLLLPLTTTQVPTTTNITYNTEEYPQYDNFTFDLNQDCVIVVEECDDDETTSQPLYDTSEDGAFNASFPNGTYWNLSTLETIPVTFAPRTTVPTTIGPEAMARYLPAPNRTHLRKLCWETMFGQEIVKLTVMDLVQTVVTIFIGDYVRAVIVRLFSKRCCWDLEKQFPGYPDFQIAENILHLVYNQGLVWMGMFFSPGLPVLNLGKLLLLFYVRSWAVVTSNVPPETVFKASDNNNFYLALLLIMLFLCTLPVGYAVVWVTPSWHCGPFSNNKRIYQLATEALIAFLPKSFEPIIDYISSPGVVIPAGLLLILIIYYLVSLTAALRETVQDLKDQLRSERTAEKRKAMEAMSAKKVETPTSKWARIIQLTPISLHKFEGKKPDPETEKPSFVAEQKQKRSSSSPIPDDTTDPGQSEVFDDSLSEPKKTAGRDPKPTKQDRMKDASTQKQRPVNIITEDLKRRGSRESSGGSSLPRSPRMRSRHHHPQKEESPSKMTQTYKESPKTRDESRPRRSSKDHHHKDSPKRARTTRDRPPEGGHDEREPTSKANQEIEKVAEEYPELAAESKHNKRAHKKGGPMSPERSDREESPSKHHSGHKHKRDKPILGMSDVHNGQAAKKKRESSKRHKREKEKEDKPPDTPEMQSIPVIKISKEDSVERSIQQAKLERQSQTTEDVDEVETGPEPPPPQHGVSPPATKDTPHKLLETDIDEPMSEAGKGDEGSSRGTGEEDHSTTDTSRSKEEEHPSESMAISPELEKELAFADANVEPDTLTQTSPHRKLDLTEPGREPGQEPSPGSQRVEPTVATTGSSPRYRSRKPPPLKIPSSEEIERAETPMN